MIKDGPWDRLRPRPLALLVCVPFVRDRPAFTCGRYYGFEFATDFTWHLHDLGIAHERITPD